MDKWQRIRLSRKQLKSLLTLAIPLLLITLFSVFLQVTFVSNPKGVELFLSSLGLYFILGYIVIQFAAIVIPPIPGSIAALTILAIFGPLKGMLLVYLVATPAECVNFLLAKKYGRPFVEKTIGEKSLRKVDYYTQSAGKETLFILKFFEDSFFDYISYGLGLTQITFKQFLLVNFGVGAINAIIKYIILVKAPNFVSSIVIIEVVSAILTLLYVYYKYCYHKQLKGNLKSIDEI